MTAYYVELVQGALNAQGVFCHVGSQRPVGAIHVLVGPEVGPG
jgi:hypothetical protein